MTRLARYILIISLLFCATSASAQSSLNKKERSALPEKYRNYSLAIYSVTPDGAKATS